MINHSNRNPSLSQQDLWPSVSRWGDLSPVAIGTISGVLLDTTPEKPAEGVGVLPGAWAIQRRPVQGYLVLWLECQLAQVNPALTLAI